jgi:Response regulator containing a CheY-like receiver domain and an HTH DNA-binding domain
MRIYGENYYLNTGLREILNQLKREYKIDHHHKSSCIIAASGMSLCEWYNLLVTVKPDHYAVFVVSQRFFESISNFFPGMIKLCLHDDISTSEFRQALLTMHRLSSQNRMPRYCGPPIVLSSVEKQILGLYREGYNVDDIARVRGVTSKTICLQRSNLMKRLGVNSLQELLSFYDVILNHEIKKNRNHKF